MIRLPPRSTRTDTLFPYTTLFRSSAQLFIYPPDFSGPPVTTLEPGIALPLPGATPDEVRSSLIWNLRAGLNVAALQCQFSPFLGTVRNYNQLLRHQAAELDRARASLERYFKRVHSKAGPRAKSEERRRVKEVGSAWRIWWRPYH